MQDAPKVPTGSWARLSPPLISAVYAVAGALWILFSDRLAAGLATSPDALSRLQTVKGWFFILVTSVILYGFLRRYARRHKEQEDRLQGINRALRTINKCNEVLIRPLNEADLLDKICRIAVEEGGYRLAWVGFAGNDERKDVRPLAWAGVDDGYLASLDIRWSDTPQGRGPTGTAICTGKPVIVQDIRENPHYDLWRTAAQERGFSSSAAFPLLKGEAAFGALNIYSDRLNAFSPAEVEILSGLANNLALGISGVRSREEQRQSEGRLRESEARYRELSSQFHALLDAIPENLMLLSPDLKVIWANRGAAEGLKKNPEDVVGEYCYSLRCNKKEPCDPCPVLESFRTGKPAAAETVVAPDGRIRELRTAPIAEAGRVVNVIELSRDITDRRKIEEQIRQAQKLESIGTLAGGVAHDFNNILSAIIGYGHVALMKMAHDDPQRLNVEKILGAADRAAHLTKDLLLFGRKQAGERKPVDLNEVIGKVYKFLKRVIGEDIECKTVLNEKPISVYADIQQIEQVLMNLATNARDAMPDGGTFTVLTEQVTLTEAATASHGFAKPGAYGMITVSDTGKGMDEVTQKRIFEPFFTTKEVGKGTGLGLAAVYGIIQQHDGMIDVRSEPGIGTTFTIYLPVITPAAREEAEAHREEAPVHGTETILLAEDDASVRNIVKVWLTEFGYTVIEAVDGEDAVRKFKENKDNIHLLLFDLIMPKMNGKVAHDEILKITPGVKVIFASGYTRDTLRQKVPLASGASMIYKPFTPNDLLTLVRSVLDADGK